MVICIIALPIFAIMGIFSLKYRMLAKEAFRCLFRTIQLKPCDTGLDQRIKISFTSKLMWWPSLAVGVYKNFAVLSWVFVILMVGSTIATGYGFYNYILYGNCNGPESSAFCAFDSILGGSNNEGTVFGESVEIEISKVKSEGYFAKGNLGSGLILHEFGCYICPYTRKTEGVVREILRNYPNIKFVYHFVPLNTHNYSAEAAGAAICAEKQGKFWEYHELLFDYNSEITNKTFINLAEVAKLELDKFSICFSSNETKNEVEKYKSEALDVGIYGTPTFVIGNDVLVGPQSYKTLKNLIEKKQKEGN